MEFFAFSLCISLCILPEQYCRELWWIWIYTDNDFKPVQNGKKSLIKIGFIHEEILSICHKVPQNVRPGRLRLYPRVLVHCIQKQYCMNSSTYLCRESVKVYESGITLFFIWFYKMALTPSLKVISYLFQILNKKMKWNHPRYILILPPLSTLIQI